MESGTLGEKLVRLEESCGRAYLDTDPVGIVRELNETADREAGALLAAALSLGRVATIRAKVSELFRRLDGRPARVLAESSRSDLRRRLAGFRHRFFGEDDLVMLGANLGRMLRERGSLGAWWPREASFESALAAFADECSRPVRGARPGSTIPLVPSPEKGSTAKRSVMFLRWMARPADGVDLGLWNHPSPGELVIPLDVHIFRISRLLGLTRARTASWRAALEVTDALRRFDPADPVRFDFALSRIGIAFGCRGKWHEPVCSACALQSHCSAAVRARRSSARRRVAHAA